ncbi:tether containing UBX domain for GLUT4 [Centruroides vittatus]|uniref:tether containing UBX domain for GLUT4 n=1 Tax=Centruroides vittatus TaxID=120091 RepID=UPI00350FC80E
MASTTTLTVLCLNGRRQKISISSNSSYLQVLEEVCKKQNLNPDDYDLRHYNKKVDLSLIIRFSGFPNNALFELAPVETRRIENDITVGLQMESGERLMHDFKPSTNLWDIICHWKKEKGELKNDNEFGEPICIYMRKELVGEETLKSTTLRNLGLTGGKAVIRFLYRQPDTLKEQAHVCVPLPKTPKIDIEESIPIDSLDKSNCRIPSNQNTTTNNVSKIFPTVGQEVPPTGDHSTDQVMIEEESHQVTEEKLDEVMDDTTVTEIENVPVENVIHIGERNAVLFNLEDNLPEFTYDLPEEFYEVTIEDVKYMFNDLTRKRRELEEKPLETSTLRERRQQTQLLSYKFSIIRIYFPDRFVLQGIFLPTETIGDVMKFVRKFLNRENTDFYLYLTPPKRILSLDAVLYQEKLVPAAILHFGSDDNGTSYLQDWVREKVSSPDAAKYTAQLSRVKKPMKEELMAS